MEPAQIMEPSESFERTFIGVKNNWFPNLRGMDIGLYPDTRASVKYPLVADFFDYRGIHVVLPRFYHISYNHFVENEGLGMVLGISTLVLAEITVLEKEANKGVLAGALSFFTKGPSRIEKIAHESDLRGISGIAEDYLNYLERYDDAAAFRIVRERSAEKDYPLEKQGVRL